LRIAQSKDLRLLLPLLLPLSLLLLLSLLLAVVVDLAVAFASQVQRGVSPASKTRREAATTLPKAGAKAQPKRLIYRSCFACPERSERAGSRYY